MNTSTSHLMNLIITELDNFKIPTSFVGYSYMKECIKIGIEIDKDRIHFGSEIYPIVANTFNTSVANIEKGIRSAIKKALQLSPNAFDLYIFNDGQVTSCKLMCYIIENIKRIIFQYE